MEEVKIPLLSPEVQAYVFASLGFRDPEAGRDLLLSLAVAVEDVEVLQLGLHGGGVPIVSASVPGGTVGGLSEER